MTVEETLELLKTSPWIVRGWNDEDKFREYQDFINWDEVQFWKMGKDYIREFKKYKREETSKWDVLAVNQNHGLKFTKEYYKGDYIIGGKIYAHELTEQFE